MLARTSSSSTNRRTRGFTLVELLVVIVIILVLASLVVAFAPRLAERQKVPRGADLVQGWLLVAKQRAKRDQVPTGIRLQPDPNNPGQYRELQYIQKPDDFNGGMVAYSGRNGPIITTTNVDFTGGFSDPTLYPVQPFIPPMSGQPGQPGDYLEIKGGGLVHLITSVGKTKLTLQSAPPYDIQFTADYRIIRMPRPLVGEASLDLPKDIAIQGYDGKIKKGWGSLTQLGQTFDVLFSPAGPVVTPAVGGGDTNVSPETIVFWVRDYSLDLDMDANGNLYPTQGEPLLVTIYVKTGFIAVHPVNQDPNDFYLFTKDGHSSGL